MPSAKTIADSHTTQIQIVLYAHCNGSGRLFGGELMSWMDVTGAVAARRHSNREVLTAAVDSLSFKTSARPGDTVVLDARLTCAGTTSMEVRVTASVESLAGRLEEICTSHFIFVAVDEDGKPTPVPALHPADDQEHAEMEAAARRRKARGR